ncbi:MAG: hypothetical protein M3Y21_01205 [Candidatus Eremiobacteraeota bacterium]|nr:hypothetical protein [Candidatus Eremiobacteraeota bacterium]
MLNRHRAVAICSLLALIGTLVRAPSAANAGPVSSVGAFDVCSLLSSTEASSLIGDPEVVKRGSYGPPGFFCAWNSRTRPGHPGHDVVIMFFTQAKIRQVGSHALSGVGPEIAAAFHSGSPLTVFQTLRKHGSSCQGYSGNLPCAEIEERVALYKHTNAYDYVVLVFAQREEGGGDAGIVRLVLDAAHVANRITPRLP